jgi:phosphoribosylpyrophosphate synthetase
MDLYRKEVQGFFSVPVDNLRASPFLLAYIKEHVRARLIEHVVQLAF